MAVWENEYTSMSTGEEVSITGHDTHLERGHSDTSSDNRPRSYRHYVAVRIAMPVANMTFPLEMVTQVCINAMRPEGEKIKYTSVAI